MVYTPTGDSNVNPVGAVAIFDSENPKIFTARVIANVSGGQFVMISGTDGTIFSSGTNSYAVNDIVVAPAVLGDNVGGIAIQTVASGTNNYVGIAREGTWLVQASEAVSGGTLVIFSSGGVANFYGASAGSASIPGILQFCSVGRSFSAADSGGYALVGLKL